MVKRKRTNENPKKKTKKEFIEIPEHDGDGDHQGISEDEDLVDQDIDLAQEALVFLNGLDKKAITRLSKDQKIENRKNRPNQPSTSKSYQSLPKISNQNQPEEQDENLDELDPDDLALGSGSDADLNLLSDMPSSISDHSDLSDFDSEDDQSYSSDDSALEQAYYANRRKRAPSSDGSSENEPTESKLPIRLPDGTIQRFPNPSTTDASRVIKTRNPSHANQQTEENPQADVRKKSKNSLDPSLGARFGRRALADILSPELDLKTRIQLAKLEIADLAQEAIADPEMSLGSIKRIFALSSPTLNHHQQNFDHSNALIDYPIRMMALLSLLAIFLDIIPGYRIRPITETEKSAKVSQMVARQREWEEGLVSIYKRYLELCEKEVVRNSMLSACCLKSLCKLLVAKTHFNFTKNIMEIVVRKLAQRDWDELSEECATSIVNVFKNDIKGDDSLQLVRLIVKTIKAKNYSVHPELLKVLLSLRLKNELSTNIRASTEKVYSSHKDSSNPRTGKLPWKDRAAGNKSKSEQPRLSKKAKKIVKARAGIEAEIAEAEESVKVEDKERNQTESLKMIFGCYFRIIKLPYRSNLLPIALESLSRFAHLVNIDFFRDLLQVLRNHINRTGQQTEHDPSLSTDHPNNPDPPVDQKKFNPHEYRDKLVCILTAFELLSGQGEALNLDLTDIINNFYDLLLEICTLIKLEEEEEHNSPNCQDPTKPTTMSKGKKKDKHAMSELMIKILEFIFFKQADRTTPQRSSLFAKRILTICLTINEPKLVIDLLQFLHSLASRQPSVHNLFTFLRPSGLAHRKTHPRERTNIEVDLDEVDPDHVGWELLLLKSHWHPSVKTEVLKLISSE